LKTNILAGLLATILGLVLCVAGQEQAKNAVSSAPSAGPDSVLRSTPSSAKPVHDAASARFEGEKRFRANCGRCHMAPHKFPPRMRVRATITDEDMRFILQYMTE
jgi:mono/diheme cytochrome c family protein